MNYANRRLKEATTAQVAALGDRRLVAIMATMTLRLERANRKILAIYPNLLRAFVGGAARHDVDVIGERLSAMDDRVRRLETSASRGEQ